MALGASRRAGAGLTVDGCRCRADHAGMEAGNVVTYDYPAEPYTEVIPGLTQASAAHPPADMLAMFDVLIDVGGRDRWEGDPDPRYSFHPLDDVPFIADAEMIHTVGERIASLVRRGEARRGELSERREPVRAPRRTRPRGARLHARAGDRGGAQRARADGAQQPALRSLPPGRLHPPRPGTTSAAVTSALISRRRDERHGDRNVSVFDWRAR